VITGWPKPPGMTLAVAGALMTVGRACVGTGPNRFQYTEVHMGVQTRIVMYAESEERAESAAKAAFARIEALENAMSDYRPVSEINRLCREAVHRPTPVSPDLFRVLLRAREIAERSGGAFDPTIGPVIALWRKARKEGRLPPVAELEAARAAVGWRYMELDRKRRTVTLSREGMRLDLGGIAKGCACDAALEVLKRHRIRSALVEMGGDIVLGAKPPGTAGWRIRTLPVLEVYGDGLESGPQGADDGVMILSNCAVSTSGDTEQFVEFAGVRYSHIVDARTGLGITNRIAVMIIAPRGELSDGLATAVAAMGQEAGRRLVEQYPGVRCFIRTAEPH